MKKFPPFANGRAAVVSSVFLAATVALAGAFSSRQLAAAPLRESDICEQAAWFAHADFDAVRDSKLGDKFEALAQAKSLPSGVRVPNGVFAVLDAAREKTGFDARRHLTGFTASGQGAAGRGVIVIRHNFANPEKLAAWLAEQPGARRDGETGCTFPKGTVVGRATLGSPVLADFAAPGVILLAANADDLAAARQRIASATQAPSPPAFYGDTAKLQTGAPPVLSGYTAPAATQHAAARKGALPPAMARVRQTAFLLEARDETLRFNLRAEFSDVETADATARMFQSFFTAQAPRFPFLGRTAVAASDAQLHLSADVPVDELLNGISPTGK